MTAKTEIMKYLKRVKKGKTGPEVTEKVATSGYGYPTVKRTLSRMLAEGDVTRDDYGYKL